jgi:hypothetical protein
MKKIICLTVFALIAGAASLFATQVNLDNYVVDVDTNGVVAVPADAARKGVYVVNEGTSTVYLTSAPATKDTYEAVGAIPLSGNYGAYEDNYYVYKSTWYAVTSTGTAKIYISEKK